MRVSGVIPARLKSTRLPRKLLLAETGRPLIQYTWDAVCRATVLMVDNALVNFVFSQEVENRPFDLALCLATIVE